MSDSELQPTLEEVDTIAGTLILNQQKTNLADLGVEGLDRQGFSIQGSRFEAHDPGLRVDMFRDPKVHFISEVADLSGTRVVLDISRLEEIRGSVNGFSYLEYIRQLQRDNTRMMENSEQEAIRVDLGDRNTALIVRAPEYSATNPQRGKFNDICVKVTTIPNQITEPVSILPLHREVADIVQRQLVSPPQPWEQVIAGHRETIDVFRRTLN